VYICPNCKDRSVDIDGFEGFSGSDALQCRRCGFGFIFQLLEDYYPAPSTGFIVCDQEARVLAAGRGVFELTGFQEGELMGRDVGEALALSDPAPIGVVVAVVLVPLRLFLVPVEERLALRRGGGGGEYHQVVTHRAALSGKSSDRHDDTSKRLPVVQMPTSRKPGRRALPEIVKS